MLISSNSGLYGNRPSKERYTIFESVELCRHAGFDAIDVNFFATTHVGLRKEYILDGDYWRANVQRLDEALKASGLYVNSTHAPYRDLMLKGEKLAEYEEYLHRAIEATAMIGAKYMVVHPLMDQLRDTLIDETVAYFRRWTALGNELGVTLAMENMFSTMPEQLMSIAEALDCAICWDTGHAHMRTEKQGDDIRAVGERLRVLHIHDNYGTMDNHNPPYFGNIDWQDVIAALRDVHYGGTFNYEVNATALPEGARMDISRYLVTVGRLLTREL